MAEAKKHKRKNIPKVTRRDSDYVELRPAVRASPKKEFDSTKIVIALGILLVLVAAYNYYMAGLTRGIANQKIADAEELARPGKLEMTAITFSGCDNCYDVNPVIEQIKSLDVNVTSVRQVAYDSEEGRTLITKYSIENLPSLVVVGEVDKSSSFVSKFSQYGSKVMDAMVVNKQVPPYYSLKEQRVVGMVSATILDDSTCKYCSSVEPLITSLKNAGIELTDVKKVEASSSDGQALIKKYKLLKSPSLILDKEAGYYQGFSDNWKNLGTVDGGAFVLRTLNPPYINLTSGKAEGVVSAILINDSSCANCYDPTVHRNILARFGVSFANETILDANSPEGNAIITKYNITKVPTLIMSEGASA